MEQLLTATRRTMLDGAAAGSKDGYLCEACSLVFPSELLLLKHRAKFCTVLVPQWASRLEEASSAVDPADLTRYFSGGAPPAVLEGVDRMSVAELRERTVRDAARLEARAADAEAMRERAARRMQQQKAQAETDQRRVEAELERQRIADLEARVQRRMAERMLSKTELEVELRGKVAELGGLEVEAERLAERKARAREDTAAAQQRLRELRSGADEAAGRLRVVEAAVRDASPGVASHGDPGKQIRLTDAAVQRRAQLGSQQVLPQPEVG